MKFKAILFHIFSIFIMTEAHAQYTYPIYGGLFITGAVNIVSIHSASSQSVRITNYNDYDTTINLTANKSVPVFPLSLIIAISKSSENRSIKL